MRDSLEPHALRAALVTSGAPWADVEHHRTIGSTNVRAAQLARPWQVVVADHQSSGRGRMRRTWQAPPGASVAVSATVPVPLSGAGWLPLLAGLAVAEAIEETTGLATRLKWPNDVLAESDDERKVSGILCEVTGDGLVVVGAGINLAQTRAELPVDTATSLRLCGAHVERTRLVAAYLVRLADWYAVLAGEGPAGAAHPAYRSRCSTLGRQVRLSQPAGPDVLGTAVEVDGQGRLVVEADGRRRAWAAGDVVHVRRSDTAGPRLT